jgi:hypothetical protein
LMEIIATNCPGGWGSHSRRSTCMSELCEDAELGEGGCIEP